MSSKIYSAQLLEGEARLPFGLRSSSQSSQTPPSGRGNWTALRHEAETTASGMPALQVEAERIANTVAFGVHGRRRIGQGETFWQFRQYQQGDMRSTIDWRKSAKSQHVFVREHEWEAADSVWIWRDSAPSLHYKSDLVAVTKWQRASVISIAMASLLVRGGERIAVLGSPHPPGSGRPALRQFARTLSTPTSETEAILPVTSELPRHAKLLVISDFMTSYENIVHRLDEITAMGVSGHLLQVTDPIEEDFPFRGHVNFKGLNANQEIAFGRSEDIQGTYKQKFNAHRDAIAEHARRIGWTFAHHRTDTVPETAVLALYNALSGELDASHRRSR